VSADEIKKALKLKAAFSNMLDRCNKSAESPIGSAACNNKESAVLEFDDIQHILLTRAPALTGRYEFLSFRHAAGGREWLASILEKVQSAGRCGLQSRRKIAG